MNTRESIKTQLSCIPPPPKTICFPNLEKNILKLWSQYKIFERSMNKNEGKKRFTILDGPPGTNGSPHIGHVYQNTFKDIWPRYKTMQGYHVERKAGWDTHGLPVELTTQKILSLLSKQDIVEFGIENFTKHCLQTVHKYQKEWVQMIYRVGRCLDFKAYASCDPIYMESAWSILKTLWEKKLVYRDYKVTGYCPHLGTTLSNQEVSQGYRSVQDLSLWVKFPSAKMKNKFFVAWTTTPWTLLGNMALVVNPDIQYVEISNTIETLILSKKSWLKLNHEKKIHNFHVTKTYNGIKLQGLRYKPLWDFFPSGEKNHQILTESFVSEIEGSGIVHMAAYGEDDFQCVKKHHLNIVLHVDLNGKFSKECGAYANKMFDEENLAQSICDDLASKNLVLFHSLHTHKYPFNYKTGTRLMFYPKQSWFLKTSLFKKQLLENNQTISWHPEHIGTGRFKHWLENNIDWAFSRERFWGTPLPIWTCSKVQCKKQICIGSCKELRQLGYNGDKLEDLHLPSIDLLKIKCPNCQSSMFREPEVLDCWFDAAIMPWGQHGYPHLKNSKTQLHNNYPADFICEGIDQTRGWFYGLLAIGTLLEQRTPYRNVLCVELVLDKFGNKMSKSQGNVINPHDIFEKYGADALRWSIARSDIRYPVKFSEDLVHSGMKEMILPLWNIFKFWSSYAHIDKYQPNSLHYSLTNITNPLDRWIVSLSQKLILNITKHLDSYQNAKACQVAIEFINDLSNWHLRRSRRRFWKSGEDKDKLNAFQSIYVVLYNLILCLAPITPFISEYIYQTIYLPFIKELPESIHLLRFPQYNSQQRDVNLEQNMEILREIVMLGHAIRAEQNIKIRSPLPSIMVTTQNTNIPIRLKTLEHLILDELNVKKIQWNQKDYKETYRINLNWKIAGPKFGKKNSAIQQILHQFSQNQIRNFIQNKTTAIFLNNANINLTYEDVSITTFSPPGVGFKESKSLKIWIDLEPNPELVEEGLLREIIHHIQNERKKQDYAIMDFIILHWYAKESSQITKIMLKYNQYIKQETLAFNIKKMPCPSTTSSHFIFQQQTLFLELEASRNERNKN